MNLQNLQNKTGFLNFLNEFKCVYQTMGRDPPVGRKKNLGGS